MFYYKNQKFHKKGIAFAVPDNTFLLEYERESDELFEISAAEDLFRIIISFESCEPTEYFKSEDFKDLYTVIEKPKNACIKGLFGQRAVYSDGVKNFCEYRLKIIDKGGVSSTFSVILETQKQETDIFVVCKHPVVAEFLDSLEISSE